MATISQERKTEIAEFLTRVASWLDGDRALAVLTLAKEFEGAESEEAAEQALKQLGTTYSVPEAVSYKASPGDPRPPHQKDKAEDAKSSDKS